MRILISGASGFIGSALMRAVEQRSGEVVRLVRGSAGAGAIPWNPADLAHPVDPARLEGFDAAIHLSGANIARRWTAAYKRTIFDSRVVSTRALAETLAKTSVRPRVLLVASGVSWYGTDPGDEILTEASAPGAGFLAEVAQAWEGATRPASDAGIRVVSLRFGMVVAREGGALGKMLPAFRLGLGGRPGTGRQWLSWVSLRDLVRAVFFLLERDDLAGAFNVTSPQPVTNRAFTQALASALHRPAVLPVPRTALRLLFGEMAEETVLASQRAVPQRLVEAGFRFEDEEIGGTLRALLG